MNHTEVIKKIIKDAVSARESLYEAILNLPDNNKVMEQTGENKFITDTSKLDNGIISPYYYMYGYQYKKIVEHLKGVQMHRILPVLKEILDLGILVHKQHRIKINPEVIKNIRGILL